ncbi:MAG: ribosome-associated translation inhibitor RaiA [Chlamydiales bacterium]|nr:ribosome-associated translation inhibitor RaiA [Chlamydiales bacterium]
MPEKTKAEVKEKFTHKEYPIQIIGRHVDITEPMKSYAIDKLSKVERFGGRVIDAVIIMDIQKLMQSVDFLVNVNNTVIKVTGRSENMYASVDRAIARLESKLRRYMKRIHEHNAKGLAEIDVNVNVIERISPLDDINDQIEEENLRHVEEELRPHRVVSKEKRRLKTLNQEEAIMKMELSEEHFLVYRSEEDQKLKVIYRRDDGNYGVIEAE